MKGFKEAKDRSGAYAIDWSRFSEAVTLPGKIEFIPYDKGDARVPSMPADDMITVGAGSGNRLTHALIAQRVAGSSVHSTLNSEQLRRCGRTLLEIADKIDRLNTG